MARFHHGTMAGSISQPEGAVLGAGVAATLDAVTMLSPGHFSRFPKARGHGKARRGGVSFLPRVPEPGEHRHQCQCTGGYFKSKVCSCVIPCRNDCHCEMAINPLLNAVRHAPVVLNVQVGQDRCSHCSTKTSAGRPACPTARVVDEPRQRPCQLYLVLQNTPTDRTLLLPEAWTVSMFSTSNSTI